MRRNGVVIAVALVLLLVTFLLRRGSPNPTALANPNPTALAIPPGARSPLPIPSADALPTAAPSTSAKPIATTGNTARDAQVRRVIASMDTTKKPPEGVAQGGNPPGAFRNREGRLPRGGTYMESDIWPSAGRSRGTERLIFGQNGEVWFTEDHYETFKRLR
jgi:ribonuclease T1